MTRMSDDEDARDRAYEAGSQRAWMTMLRECITRLGPDERNAEAWRLERAAAVIVLRRICEEFGDNDWDDELHLEDVLEKHLANHLGRSKNARRTVRPTASRPSTR